MALRAPVPTVALERHTSALSPRGTSGERAGERGFAKIRSLLSPALLHFMEERESFAASSVPVAPEQHIPGTIKFREPSD
jgi:hypothetical protein